MRYADNKCTYMENATHYVYTGKCIVTGEDVEVRVPKEELFAYRQGTPIQDAMPSLSDWQREFLMSGIGKTGWEQMFGSDSESEPDEDDYDWEDVDDWGYTDDYDPPIDGVGFADPGGRSALRAATKDNPRDQPCPTCGAPNRLTRIDVARGYQCDSCADRAERGGY